MNNNGNMTLDAPLSTFTPDPLNGLRREVIAPFWADVDTRATRSSVVAYGRDTVNGRPAFGANYINVGYFNSRDDRLNSFQVVLIDRSDTGAGNVDIEFNYERMEWETGDASGGRNGLGGSSARVGYSNGTGSLVTSFELPGSSARGSFLDGSATGLIRRSLGSTVPGRLVFSARSGVITQSLSVTPPFLVFLSPSGARPDPQSLSVTSSGGPLSFTVSTATDDGRAWLESGSVAGVASPASNTPLSISVNPALVPEGGQARIVRVSSNVAGVAPQEIPVYLIRGPNVPYTVRAGVVNAASFLSGVVSPGALFSIFGLNLASRQEAFSAVPLPTTLAGTRVEINGRPVPLFLVSPGQINGQVPIDTEVGEATLTISSNSVQSANVRIGVAPAIPGIFTFPNSSLAIVQNENFSVNSASNPARVGRFVVVYLTGLGRTDILVPDGVLAPGNPLSRASLASSASIGGVPARVDYLGLTPGLIGVGQANVLVPTTLRPGLQQLVLSIGGAISAAATLHVSQ